MIELLITMALICIMFVMMYGFSSRSHQQQQKVVCQKNLATIHVALQIFATDHDGAFPVRTNAATSEAALAQLVPKYTAATEPFICPGSKDKAIPEGEPFDQRRISYAYWMGRRLDQTNSVLASDRQINTRLKQPGEPVFSPDGKPPGNNHHKYGGNFLFTDGHLESSGVRARFAIQWPSNVVMLNPRE